MDKAIEEGVPAEKIVVGGFSQGGVVALAAALRSDKKLAGCAALSTYLAGARGDALLRSCARVRHHLGLSVEYKRKPIGYPSQTRDACSLCSLCLNV